MTPEKTANTSRGKEHVSTSTVPDPSVRLTALLKLRGTLDDALFAGVATVRSRLFSFMGRK